VFLIKKFKSQKAAVQRIWDPLNAVNSGKVSGWQQMTKENLTNKLTIFLYNLCLVNQYSPVFQTGSILQTSASNLQINPHSPC